MCVCDLLCFCWLHSWHPTSSWLPRHSAPWFGKPSRRSAASIDATCVASSSKRVSWRQLAPAGDGNSFVVIINMYWSNLFKSSNQYVCLSVYDSYIVPIVDLLIDLVLIYYWSYPVYFVSLVTGGFWICWMVDVWVCRSQLVIFDG